MERDAAARDPTQRGHIKVVVQLNPNVAHAPIHEVRKPGISNSIRQEHHQAGGLEGKRLIFNLQTLFSWYKF
jgi:hypothetical protein